MPSQILYTRLLIKVLLFTKSTAFAVPVKLNLSVPTVVCSNIARVTLTASALSAAPGTMMGFGGPK